MQQDPTPKDIHAGAPNKQHDLGNQYHVDKINVLVLYANINNTLGQEWKNKLEHTPHQKTDNQLQEQTFVFKKILKQEPKMIFYRFLPNRVA